jgi:hypothetical protein
MGADAVARWFGPDRKGSQTYAEAFHAAWADRAGAERPRVRSDQ